MTDTRYTGPTLDSHIERYGSKILFAWAGMLWLVVVVAGIRGVMAKG